MRVFFLDLAAVSRGERLLAHMASQLGLGGADSLPDLLFMLNAQPSLVILDCCEHLIDDVSGFAEKLRAGAEDCQILCTSQEALNVPGERIINLPPLEYPAARPDLTAAEALRYPAIQLLCEAAAASCNDFALADEDAPVAAGICRKLDGVALALGLAGACVGAFGMQVLAKLLDQNAALYWKGRRTSARPPDEPGGPPWSGAMACSTPANRRCCGRCRHSRHRSIGQRQAGSAGRPAKPR